MSATWYLWQGASLAEEWHTSNSVDRWHYEPGTFRPLAKETVRGEARTFYPIVTDQVGTPKEMYTAEGECVWKADHTLWGKLRLEWRQPEEPSRGLPEFTCNLRVQGQWWDAESRLHYNFHRHYDPSSAIYLSPDPIGLAGGMRLYGYVHNPLSWLDPLGLTCGPAKTRNSRGQWIDQKGKFANTPPRPNYVAESARHEAGIPGTTKGYHAYGTPDPVNSAGMVVPKSKFGIGEGGSGFATAVYNHPDVNAEYNSYSTSAGPANRWTYEVSDMGRDPALGTGTDRTGATVQGGFVVVEGNPPLNPALYNPNEVVTQYPNEYSKLATGSTIFSCKLFVSIYRGSLKDS